MNDFKEMSFMDVIDLIGFGVHKDLRKDSINKCDADLIIEMIDLLKYFTSDEVSIKLMSLSILLMAMYD